MSRTLHFDCKLASLGRFRLTEDAERFVDTVVPILQTRGVFPVNRHTYERPLVTV